MPLSRVLMCSAIECFLADTTELPPLAVCTYAALALTGQDAESSVRSSMLSAILNRGVALATSVGASSREATGLVRDITKMYLEIATGQPDPSPAIAAIAAIVNHSSSPDALQAVKTASLTLEGKAVPVQGGAVVISRRRTVTEAVLRVVRARVEQLTQQANEEGPSAGGHHNHHRALLLDIAAQLHLICCVHRASSTS